MTKLAKWRPLLSRYKLSSSGRSFSAHALSIDVASTGPEDVAIRVRLALPEARRGLQLRGLARSLDVERRVITGDDSFDEHVFLSDEPSILQALDFHTRRLLVTLVASGVEAYGGGLVIDPWATDALSDPVETVNALFELLSKLGEASAAKTAWIIRTDPVLPTRELYAAAFKDHAEVQALLSEHQVREVGHASDEGFEALTRAVMNDAMAVSVRVEAIDRLLVLFPLSRVMPVLERANAEVVNASVEFITRSVASPDDAVLALPIISRVVSRKKLDAAVATRIINAIVSSHNAGLLPVLGTLVNYSSDELVSRDALVALMGFNVPARELAQVMSEQGIRLAETLAPKLCERDPKLDRRLLLPLYQRLQPREVHAKTRYLRLFDSDSFLPLVLEELETTEHLDVRVAAINVLARLGSRKHIGVLRPFTEGLLRDAETKATARAAIETIRTRHPNEGEAGSVSMASEGGEISVSK